MLWVDARKRVVDLVELKIKHAEDLFPLKEALEKNGYCVQIFLDIKSETFSIIAKMNARNEYG